MRYLSTSSVILAWVMAFGGFGCTKVCAPNQQVVCACPGSAAGVQICNPNGEGYGECICPGDGGAAGQGSSNSGGAAGQGGSNSGGVAGQGGSSSGGVAGQGGPGGSGPSCTDDCVAGNSWCDGGTQYSCAEGDMDPCLEALPQGPCPPEKCDGPDQMKCGNCGSQTRTCSNGKWSSWSPCMDEGECSEGEVQPCAGGTKTCSPACMFEACDPSCGGGNEGQFDVLDYQYPSYGPAGCSGDGSGKLKMAAEMITPTVVKFYITKEDGTAFGQAATLTVYVGDGPTCSPANVPNVPKTTAAVAVGQAVQEVVLTVNPYNGAWNAGETKKFWVAKSEGGFPAYRASGVVNVKKVCDL